MWRKENLFDREINIQILYNINAAYTYQSSNQFL